MVSLLVVRPLLALSLLLCLVIASMAYARQFIIFNEQVYAFVEREYGTDARTRVMAWSDLLRNKLPYENTVNAKMKAANDFFNAVPWQSDSDHWGQEDYWATPIELLATNAGDCEDYSVAKYYSLRYASVPDSKLRITYVKSLTYNQAHMVLAYYPTPNADPLILDNINGQILPASQREDLLPVYSFNGDSIFMTAQNQKKLSKSSEGGLPKWKQLNQRFIRQLRGQK